MANDILVVGFYDKKNLGDDLFKDVLQNWLANIPSGNNIPTGNNIPQNNIMFVNPGSVSILPPADVILIGGGDLVNDYFMKRIRDLLTKSYTVRPPIYGVGLGFPYPSLVYSEYLDIFDFIQTRTSSVTEQLEKIMPGRYFLGPDLVRGLTTTKNKKNTDPKKIGIFFASSMISNKTSIENTQIFKKLVNVLDNIAAKTKSWLSMTKTYHLYLYAMNTSGTIDDDRELITKIYKILTTVYNRTNITLVTDEIHDPMTLFSSFYATICTRFHSHILSLNNNIPFISLYSTSKVQDLLQTENLLEYSVKMTTDELLVPQDFDADMLLSNFDKLVTNYDTYKTVLQESSDATNVEILQTKQIIQNLVYYKPRYVSIDPTPFLNKIAKYLHIPRSELENHLKQFTKVGRSTETVYRQEIEYVAQVATFAITRTERAEFTWGLVENLSKGQSLTEAVKWIVNNNIPAKPFLKSTVDFGQRKYNFEYFDQDLLAGMHRSGWQYVVDHMKMYHNPNGIIFDSYLDKTFGWNKDFFLQIGLLPFRKPWSGVFHHLPNVEYDKNNLEYIITSDVFRKSLKYCQGLFVLSRYLADFIRARVPGVTVTVAYHPTQSTDNVWSIDKFNGNEDKKVVQIGAWMRDTYGIFALPQPKNLRKCALQGKKMENYYPNDSFLTDFQSFLNTYFSKHRAFGYRDSSASLVTMTDSLSLRMSLEEYRHDHIEDEHSSHHHSESSSSSSQCPCRICRHEINKFVVGLYDNVKKDYESVEIISTLNNEKYDDLLAENIVFLKLVDASACNTLIECIVRNTPIVINRLPAVEEYLGKDYPLYYTTLTEAYELLNDTNLIYSAHQYLVNMDKEFLDISSFLSRLV